MNEEFKLVNFQECSGGLSGNLVTYANSRLSDIIEHAPDGAVPTATIERLGSGFRFTVQLITELGTFVSDVLSTDFRAGINQLEVKLRAQFSAWHRDRFGANPLKNINQVMFQQRPNAYVEAR